MAGPDVIVSLLASDAFAKITSAKIDLNAAILAIEQSSPDLADWSVIPTADDPSEHNAITIEQLALVVTWVSLCEACEIPLWPHSIVWNRWCD